MTKEERDYLIRRIISIKKVMENETIPPVLKETLKDTLDDLYKRKCCCLVEVCFYLINGDKVSLDNDVAESVTRSEYHGDEIDFPIYSQTNDKVPVVEVFRRLTCRYISIPISSIAYVSMKKSNETDWKLVWKNLNCAEKKEREEYYQKYGRAILLHNRMP